MILAPFLFVSQPVRLSRERIATFVSLLVGLLFLVPLLGIAYAPTFSDRVRVAIYEALWNDLTHHGGNLFGRGEAAFIAHLNSLMPSAVTSRIDLEHAHNAYLHVQGSYGLLALMCFVLALGLLLARARTIGSARVVLLVSTLAVLMLYETILSDARAMFVTFLLLGAILGADQRNTPGRTFKLQEPEDSSAASVSATYTRSHE